ncbi:MAG: cell division/cell wall cluster transcriptional repressor MraZ [Rhodobacteraceae bacterium]|nr:cell division/cell wall cluster transcriptional repressor MraZ [Paracoccaceae bacterium]
MLTIFRGESLHKMDQKGRVSIPADFRKIIINENSTIENDVDNSTVVVVFGDSRQEYLECYPVPLSIEIHEKIKEKYNRGSAERDFLENFYETKSIFVQLDPNGRMLIPYSIRQKAALGSNVCFAGKGETFQIWNPERYASKQDKLEAMFRGEDEVLNPLVLLD